MKNRLELVAGTLALVLCIGSSIAYGQQKSDAQVQKVANSWLALVDAGKYAQSWEQASGYFKSKVTKDQWVAQVSATRSRLGKLKSRSAATPQYLHNPPGAPPGNYARLQYRTGFADASSTVETCALVHEKNGQWRVVGYFVRPE